MSLTDLFLSAACVHEVKNMFNTMFNKRLF